MKHRILVCIFVASVSLLFVVSPLMASSSYEQWEKCRGKAASSVKQSEVGTMGVERHILKKCGSPPVKETGTKEGVDVEPRDLVRSQAWKQKFMEITKSKYKEFVKRFEVSGPTVLENGWIIGAGQAAHSGGFDEAALAIKASTGQVYGAMLEGGTEIYGFGFGPSWTDAPPYLQKWARDNGLR